MSPNSTVIAIDGPAASGKGTLARRLAAHYGFRHLDTGLLYRAVGADMLEAGADLSDPDLAARYARSIDPTRLDRGRLAREGIGEAASIVSAHPAVRAALLDFQRAYAATPPGAVLDGRDIGTVVCPRADVKLFVDAAPSARAKRRWKEMRATGSSASEADVLADIERRDARDAARAVAPLKPAEDAHLLDTTLMDIETAFVEAVARVDAALGAKGVAIPDRS